jgi:hypothetical protein
MKQEHEAKLREALQALADSSSGAQAPLALEAALREEFRAAHPKRVRRHRLVWTWVAAAAAVLVLTVAVQWRSTPAPVNPVAGLPGLPAEVAYQPAPLPTQLEAPRAQTVSLRPPTVEAPLEPLSPWYYNAALPAAGAGHVVRVEVSRQAARSFGLVAPAEGPAMVKADVWIGDDGMTRAIRFVR